MSASASSNGTGPVADNPAHQVLNNQELASIIINYFAAKENPKDDNKKALAALATLNKSFFHASTDSFWRTLPSVSPFLRLLPLFPGEEKAEYEAAMKVVHSGDPWARFRFYHRKTVRLELSDDKTIGKQMPNHWFFCLSQLPSRPAILFPKLSELEISSTAGLNSVLPFHMPPTLRHVIIKDISAKNTYDGLKKVVLTSIFAGLGSKQQCMRSMTIRTPLTPAMTASFSQFSALQAISLSFPASFPLDHLACLNALPQLKKVILISRDSTGSIPTVPAEGAHLNSYHPLQGKTPVTDLNIVGDGFFIFWASVFLVSPALVNFSAKTPRNAHASIQGVFMHPQTLDIISKRSPNVAKIKIEWDRPTDPNLIGDLNAFVDEPCYRVPQGLFHTFARLTELQRLEIGAVPFVSTSFSTDLLRNLKHMKKLAFLRLQSQALISLPLVHPTLDVLQTLAQQNPALSHVCLMLDAAEIPSAPVDFSAALQHKLKTLYVFPRKRTAELKMTEVINLATYLNVLFPSLVDLTGWFEAGKPGALPYIPGKPDTPLEMWQNVDTLLKAYQFNAKRQVAAA